MADFILMPQMGVSEESALLANWLVKEGDVILIMGARDNSLSDFAASLTTEKNT